MYGISTLCLHDQPLASALEQLAVLTGHIEVMDEGQHFLETAEPLMSYSTRFSIHAPSRGTNIASQLEPIRKASVEVMAQCFSVAGDVNAAVVVHPGYFAWPNERDHALRQLARSIGELNRISDELSVRYYIENMGNWDYFFLKRPEELPIIGDAGFALDVGHAHLNHCLAEFLTCPAQHYHIHDNDGTADAHVTVGRGTIDFIPVVKTLRSGGGTAVIEVGTLEGVVESLGALEKISA
ncbi:MAG: sugar phosphate isomerase/epimerase family protein [Methanoregula sp.]|jgi:sugar phosphate isomerase/epimerase